MLIIPKEIFGALTQIMAARGDTTLEEHSKNVLKMQVTST